MPSPDWNTQTGETMGILVLTYSDLKIKYFDHLQFIYLTKSKSLITILLKVLPEGSSDVAIICGFDVIY